MSELDLYTKAGLAMSVFQILQAAIPGAKKSIHNLLDQARDKRDLKGFIETARGLDTTSKEHWVKLIREDKAISDELKKAKTRTELRAVLEPIASLFDSAKHREQVDEWAKWIENSIFDSEATPGEKIIDDRAEDRASSIIQNVAEAETRLAQKIDAIPDLVNLLDNPLETTGKILQKRHQHGPVRNVTYSIDSGQRRIELAEGAGFTIKATGEPARALENFTKNWVTTVIDLSDPNIQIVLSDPRLSEVFRFANIKSGFLQFKPQPKVYTEKVKYRIRKKVFSIETRLTIDNDKERIAFEVGANRCVRFSIDMRQGEIHWSFHFEKKPQSFYDANDLPLLRFLASLCEVQHFELSVRDVKGLKFPLSRDSGFLDRLEEIGGLVDFAIRFVEANRLLIAHDIIAEQLPWPDFMTDEIDGLYEMFGSVIRTIKDRKQARSLTTTARLLSGQHLNKFKLTGGKFMSEVTVERGFSISGAVRFKEVIKMSNPNIEFWDRDGRVEAETLEEAARMAGDDFFFRLNHPRARISYEPFDEKDSSQEEGA